MRSAVGLSATMTPRREKPARGAVRTVRIPGVGRIGLTRDQGDAAVFGGLMLSTRLRALVREPDGKLIEERDLGSGLVTNVGVLALAADFGVPGVATNPASLFANLKYHAWGTGATAAAVTDIKLQTPAAPNATEATEGINTLSTNGEGKPKLISTSKITAESTLSITEWGIFTAKILAAATGEPLTAVSATTGTTTGTALTASSATAIGETLKIVNTTESEDSWGLITKNTTSVVTVPAWYKSSSGAVKEPTSTSKYKIRPVMFDHRVFASIGVETGNKIEFPYELEIKSGG